MSPTKDPVLTAVARVEHKVDDLVKRVDVHETKLRWIATVAIAIVGAIGGPNAVHLISTFGA